MSNDWWACDHEDILRKTLSGIDERLDYLSQHLAMPHLSHRHDDMMSDRLRLEDLYECLTNAIEVYYE